MERIGQFLFNFNRAYLYIFIAGILVSLAANIFTTVLLQERLPAFAYYALLLTCSLFISSFSAFKVSALLEDARSEWESAGSPKKDPVVKWQDYIGKKERKELLKFYFAIIFFGPIHLIIYCICLLKEGLR